MRLDEFVGMDQHIVLAVGLNIGWVEFEDGVCIDDGLHVEESVQVVVAFI